MAKKVITDAFVSIGGIDISNHVRSVIINYRNEVQDTTAMSELSRTRLPGLNDWDIQIEAYNDYADNDFDEDMWALVGTSVAVIVRHESEAVGATNPQYAGSAIFSEYNPIAGAVGEVVMTPINLQGNGVLTRTVA